MWWRWRSCLDKMSRSESFKGKGKEAKNKQTQMSPTIPRSASSSNILLSPPPPPPPPSSDVYDEYMKAIRTNSYADMYAKVHHNNHLYKSHSTPPPTSSSNPFSSPSSSSSIASFSNLSDYLTPTDEDTLLNSTSDIHSVLRDYFLVGLEAWRVCAALLSSIERVRREHKGIDRLLRDFCGGSINAGAIAAYVELENPLANLNSCQFRRVGETYRSLIERLGVSQRRIKRRIKVVRVVRMLVGMVLVVVCSGVVVAVLVVPVVSHGIVAAVAAACPVGVGVRRIRSSCGARRLKRISEQVDAATKGAYIVSHELETMGSMVARLHDEVEHGKEVLRFFLNTGGERYLLKEMAREMDDTRDWFVGQLEELEEHVFWCLKTINRTRKLPKKFEYNTSSSSNYSGRKSTNS